MTTTYDRAHHGAPSIDTTSEVRPEEYDHRTAWALGAAVYGGAIAAVALAGAIVLRVQPWDPDHGGGAEPAVSVADGLDLLQFVGLAVLAVGTVLVIVGKAAQQVRGRLPAPFLILIDAVAAIIESIARRARGLLRRSEADGSPPSTPNEHDADEARGDANRRDRTLHGREIADVRLSAIAIVAGGVFCGIGAALLAELGLSGAMGGIGVAAAAASLSGLLGVSRRVVSHAAALFASTVFIAIGANVGPGTRAAIIALGLLWTVAIWGLVVAARHLRLWAILCAVAIGAIALALLDEIDNTLRSLASPGSLPRSFGDLAPLTNPAGAADRVRSVGETWRDFLAGADRGDVVPHDHDLRIAYVIIDSSLFAVAVALLLFVLARSLAGRLGAAEERARNIKSILTVTQFAMPIYLALDIAENFTGAAAVQSVTGTATSRPGLADLTEFLAVLHWATGALKWATLLGGLVAIVAGLVWVVTAPIADRITASSNAPAPTWRVAQAGLVAPSPDDAAPTPADDASETDASPAVGLLARWDEPYGSLARTSSQWRTRSARPTLPALSLMRANIVIVLIIFLALRNPQAYDSIRALVDHDADAGSSRLDFVPAVFLVALAVGAGVTIRVLGELLVRQVRGDGRTRVAGRVGHALIVVSLALVFWLFLDSPGLLVAVGLYVALELLSLPLRGGEVVAADDEQLKPWVQARSEQFSTWRASLQLRHWLSIVGAVALFLLCWLASALGSSSTVRWVLVVFSSLVALHAILDLTLRKLAPDWSGTNLLLGDGADEEPPARDHDEDDEHRSRVASTSDVSVIAHVLGALVSIAIGAAVARSALGLIIYGEALADDSRGDVSLFALGIGLAFIGILTQQRLRLGWLRTWSPVGAVAAVRLVLATIVGIYVLVWETISVGGVIDLARGIGAIGVLLLFAILLVVMGTAITYIGAATTPVRSLRLFGIEHPPLFTLLFVWLLLASVIDGGGYHDVPVTAAGAQFGYQPVDADEPPPARARGLALTPEDALDRWMAECAQPADGTTAVPLIFVAASGGGIRAAYWTAANLEALDAAIGDRFGEGCNPIFAASGASGGSLGLGVYVVDALASDGRSARSRLAEDYLSPTVGWFLFADLVRPFMLWDGDGQETVDRGEMLERAWSTPLDASPAARSLDDVGRCRETLGDDAAPEDASDTAERRSVSLQSGLRETWCLGAPLLILNGTEVGSGCRFIASVLDNGDPDTADDPTAGTCLRPRPADTSDSGPLGATIDLVDSLCVDQDITLATAALLSARFPFVSPSGRVPIRRCNEDGTAGTGLDEPAYVVDGGYIDNSGAGSVVQLWSDISTTIDRHNAPYVAAGAVEAAESDDETGADGDADQADQPTRPPCIVPFFVQLDNGYDFNAASVSSRPLELIVPLQAAAASRGSREAEAKQIAAEIFSPSVFSGALTAVSGDREIGRWFRVVPEAHPGIQAPLGWVLSDAAEADLDHEAAAQLGRGGALGDLVEILQADLTCRPPTTP